MVAGKWEVFTVLDMLQILDDAFLAKKVFCENEVTSKVKKSSMLSRTFSTRDKLSLLLKKRVMSSLSPIGP